MGKLLDHEEEYIICIILLVKINYLKNLYKKK